METLIVIIVTILAVIFYLMWRNDEVCDFSICDVLSHYCCLHKDKSIIEAKEVDLEKEIDEVIPQIKENNMKLIDKDALVAEIEKLKERYRQYPTRNTYEDGLKDGRMIGYEDAMYKINTLKVPEVDLDKMLTEFMSRYAYENGGEYPSSIDIAHRFFELGLAHKKE